MRVLALVVVLSSCAFGGATTAPAPWPHELVAEKARLFQEFNAKNSSLSSQLQTVRSQLELYRMQHRDRRLTLAQICTWSVLTETTNVDGFPGIDFGPYLQRAPVNPFTGGLCVGRAGRGSAAVGWTYNPRTGAIRAVVPRELEGLVYERDAEFIPRKWLPRTRR